MHRNSMQMTCPSQADIVIGTQRRQTPPLALAFAMERKSHDDNDNDNNGGDGDDTRGAEAKIQGTRCKMQDAPVIIYVVLSYVCFNINY